MSISASAMTVNFWTFVISYSNVVSHLLGSVRVCCIQCYWDAPPALWPAAFLLDFQRSRLSPT
jgi:hypothetical protein